MNTPDKNETCPECGGSGTVIVFSPMLDRVDEVPTRCPRCRGAKSRADDTPVSQGDSKS